MNNLEVLNNYTVLYIEDDLRIQENIKEVLEHYFKEVFVSSNIKNANKIYIEKKPDLIISDVKVEDEIGIDFIKHLRQVDKKTRVVITSAYTNVDYLLSAAELLLLKYIVKPITQDKLNEAFELFLNSYKDEDILYFNSTSHYNKSKSIVKICDIEHSLTKKEDMFVKLLLSKNRVVSYDELQNHLCDDDSMMSQNAMRLFIKNLRKKLPNDLLKNMQGVGYYFNL